MAYTPATTTRRAPAALDPVLLEFYDRLRTMPLPAGAVGWAWGDSTRARERAEELRAAGLSRARWGQSPHHWSPALALDVWPVDAAGEVLADPEDYWPITELAESMGLQTGCSWEWRDCGHVYVPDWRDRVGETSSRNVAPALVLLLLAWAASRRR